MLIELGLEERPDAVANPWNVVLETENESPQPLPEGTKVIDIFDAIGAGRTLLILGEPGSGKTTTLLELTRDLITRAEQDIDHLIPVVFNLSTWASKQQKIADWLVEELYDKYNIPRQIGQPWVKEQQLLPLLDGLDEVKAEYRDGCIAALNQFQQEYGAEIVVCSRIEKYEALSNRLKFQSAINLRSLTLEQVCCYLDSVNADLTGLRAFIEEDTTLQELAKSPLMLNIMTLAYQGVAVEDLPKVEMMAERRKQVFDAYIKRMFRRPYRSKVESRYSESETKRWLIWLAQRISQESQTIFLIERIQPHWCNQQLLYKLFIVLSIDLLLILTSKLIYGIFLAVSLVFNLEFTIIYEGLKWWIKLPSYISILPVTFLLPISIFREIKLVERLLGKQFFLYLGFGVIFYTLFYLVSDVFLHLFPALNNTPNKAKFNYELAYTCLMNLGFFISRRFLINTSEFIGFELEARKLPNQGIKESAKNAAFMGILGGLIGGILLGGCKFILDQKIEELVVVVRGVYVGIICTLIFGGFACIQHFFLRWILVTENSMPWNYARFLDYAAERIFLRKVGGGYIFVHRLLMEHFAQMELER